MKQAVRISGILFLTVVIALQVYFNKKGIVTEKNPFYFIADGNLIRPFFLGHQNMVSDIYWIKTVLYMGRKLDQKNYPYVAAFPFMERDITNKRRFDQSIAKEYGYIYELINMVTALDPYFKFPYILGGLFVPLKTGNSEAALDLLDRAEKIFPDEWRIPFLQGFNYFFYKGEPEKALVYFTKASRYHDCPPGAAKLAGIILKNLGQKGAAIQFLHSYREQVKDKRIKKEIDNYIESIKKK